MKFVFENGLTINVVVGSEREKSYMIISQVPKDKSEEFADK